MNNPEEKNFTILVAEDEPLLRELILIQLSSIGYTTVIEAENGQQALEFTCLEKPDIVLMDIKMPYMNGLEATRRIQATCPTPVVMLTSHDSANFLEEASQAGAGAYLVKPPKPRELERAMVIAQARHADLMKLKRLNDELNRALDEINVLRGFLPICSYCKKIRQDDGYWEQLEEYIQQHSDARFSHSICPECYKDNFPDLL